MMARHSSLPWKHQLEMPTCMYVTMQCVCVCVGGGGEEGRREGGRGGGIKETCKLNKGRGIRAGDERGDAV